MEVDNLSVSLCAVAEQEEEGAVRGLERAVDDADAERRVYQDEEGFKRVSEWSECVRAVRLLGCFAYLEMRAGIRVSRGFLRPVLLAPDILLLVAS